MKNNIDIAHLRTQLAYDAATGKLTWLISRGKARRGEVAGCLDGQGYVVIGLMGRIYNAHRIAWALHYGEWPAQDIDHENTIKSDNRIDNLRLCTMAQNQANIATRSTNTSGAKGVTWNKSRCKWQAQIKVCGRNKYLGLHDDIESAAKAYAAAATAEHGNFSRITP